jgi:hypothetical protein
MPLPFPRRVPSGKARALELNSIGCCQSLGWRNRLRLAPERQARPRGRVVWRVLKARSCRQSVHGVRNSYRGPNAPR